MIKYAFFFFSLLALGVLYLWGVENCRALCGVLWGVFPVVCLSFAAWLERGRA